MHFFTPFFALFSLVGSPIDSNASLLGQMQHFRGPFRAPRRIAKRPPLSHRNDELASLAKAVQYQQSPDISDAIIDPVLLIPFRPRKSTCIKEYIPKWGRTSVYLRQRHDHDQPASQSPAEDTAAFVLHSSPLSLRLCSPQSGMPHHPAGEIARSQECMV